MAWMDSISIEKPLLILSVLSSGLCFGLITYYIHHQWKSCETGKTEVSEKIEGIKLEKGEETKEDVEKKDQ
jgi:hypothetical protein